MAEQRYTSSGAPFSAAAARHAERIQQGEQARPKSTPAAGKTTAERYAERILPGYKADEKLREQARLNELKTRGVWTPGDDNDQADDVEEEFEPEVEEEQEERTPTTAELYAARTQGRDSAERRSALASYRSAWQSQLPPKFVA